MARGPRRSGDIEELPVSNSVVGATGVTFTLWGSGIVDGASAVFATKTYPVRFQGGQATMGPLDLPTAADIYKE